MLYASLPLSVPPLCLSLCPTPGSLVPETNQSQSKQPVTEGLGCPPEGVPSPEHGARPRPGEHMVPLPSPHLKTCFEDVLGVPPPSPSANVHPLPSPRGYLPRSEISDKGERGPRTAGSFPPPHSCALTLGMCIHGPISPLALTQKWPQPSPLEGCRLALPGRWLPAPGAVLSLHGGPSHSQEGAVLLV